MFDTAKKVFIVGFLVDLTEEKNYFLEVVEIFRQIINEYRYL